MSVEPVDPFEMLVSANPVPDESMVAVRPDSLARVVASAQKRRRRRRWLWAPPLVAVAAASAAGYVASRETTEHVSVGCYAEASLDADTTVVRSEPSDAIATCEAVWREGQMVAGVTEPPPLHACVVPSGGIGVFPGSGEGTCRLLGEDVDPPTPTTTVQDDVDRSSDPAAAAELLHRLADASPKGGGCMSGEESRRIAEDLLDALDMGGWRIETGPGATGEGFDDDRPCASYALDEANRTVLLVPIPRPSR